MYQKHSGSFPSWECRLKAFPVNSVVTALWGLSLIHSCRFCCMSLLLIAGHCSQKSFTFLRRVYCSQSCSSGLLCLNLSYSTYYYDFQWNTLRKYVKIRFLSKIREIKCSSIVKVAFGGWVGMQVYCLLRLDSDIAIVYAFLWSSVKKKSRIALPEQFLWQKPQLIVAFLKQIVDTIQQSSPESQPYHTPTPGVAKRKWNGPHPDVIYSWFWCNCKSVTEQGFTSTLL